MDRGYILSPRGRIMLRLSALTCAGIVTLWALNIIDSGGLTFFLMGCVAVTVFALDAVARLKAARWDLAAYVLLFALLVLVPMGFDPTTSDVFNLTKFTVVAVGAAVIGGLLGADYIMRGRRLFWRNGLHWPVLALLVWTVIATLTSTNLRLSILGFYKSYDGLLTHLALGVLFFSVVHLFTINHVKTLISVIYYGGGGLVALYGLLQLHDRTFEGAAWDWVEWGPIGFRDTAIWSGLGNPNHLAGFLAVLLPIGLVLLLVHRDWRVRLVTIGMSIWMILEVIQTTTRGAWLAVLISVPVLLILLAPEVKARWTIPIPIVGLVIAGVVISGVVLGGSRNIPQILGSVLDFGPLSSATQRVELWKSAADMASDRPVFGFGPDTYRLAFQEYQTETYVENFGVGQIANGPHNVFMNYLATEGVPGLLLFLLVVVVAACRTVGGWMRLRLIERTATAIRIEPARDGRLLLSGAAAAVVAYLVQGSFNVQQIALSFVFWVLLGVVCIIAIDVGVPPSLRPSELLNPGLITPLDRDRSTKFRSSKKQRSGAASNDRQDVARSRLEAAEPNGRGAINHGSGRLLAVAGVAIIIVALMWPLTGPYRADHHYLEARRNLDTSAVQELVPDEELSYLNSALAELKSAVSDNPWEATYATETGRVAATIGQLKQDHATLRGSSDAPFLDGLREARRFYERALSLEPQNARILHAHAQVLLEMTELDSEDPAALEEEAARSLRAAIEANPWFAEPVALLASMLAEHNEPDEARALIESAPEFVRNDDAVQAVAGQLTAES